MRFASPSAGLVFVLSTAFLAAPSLCSPALAQKTVPSPDQPVFLELEHRSSAQMDPSDIAWIQKRHRQIAAEAAFFGYDLSLPGWSYDQTVCPALADDMVLHYRRESQDGAVSLFTALVPRTPARVFVVPVLYRNATPFHSAAGSDRSLDVFNRAVPGELAEAALAPHGNWLLLGACYADLVGGEAYVMERSASSIALVRAPQPTLRLSAGPESSQIIFTDRDAPSHYTVWDLSLNRLGRLTAATATPLADYIAQAGVGPAPHPKQPRSEPASASEATPTHSAPALKANASGQNAQPLPPPAQPVVAKPMPTGVLTPDQAVPSKQLPPLQTTPQP